MGLRIISAKQGHAVGRIITAHTDFKSTPTSQFALVKNPSVPVPNVRLLLVVHWILVVFGKL